MPHTRSVYPINYVSLIPWINQRNSQRFKSLRLSHGTHATYQICLSTKLDFFNSLDICENSTTNQTKTQLFHDSHAIYQVCLSNQLCFSSSWTSSRNSQGIQQLLFLQFLGQIRGNTKESTKRGYFTERMPHTRSAYPTNSVSLVPWKNPRSSQGIKETRLSHGPRAIYQICLPNEFCFFSSLDISKEFPRNQRNKAMP